MICDSNSYSLHTRISNHIKWIKDTLFQLETSKSLPACRVTIITSSPPIRNTTVCMVPLDPTNGYRLLHKSYCQTQEDCAVEEDAELVSGSHLIYTCNQGYELSGTSDILCSPEGKWINIPVCTEIRCKSLASRTIFADCKYNDVWTSCETDVLPGTITKISYKPGYNKYPRVQADNKMELICKKGGYWSEDPMECLPIPLRSLWETATKSGNSNWKFVVFAEVSLIHILMQYGAMIQELVI